MRTGLLITFGVVMGSTLSTMIAIAWTAPTASPPGNNVASPINVSSTAQLKNGTLGVNGLGVFGNTILNGSNGDGTGNGVNSYLNFGATAGQSGYGIRDNNGTLEFRNSSGSWGSLNVTLTNLMQVNGITTNGLGQITSIKFGDGTTETTANPWSTNGTKIYYNGGFVGIGTSNPPSPLTIQTSGETGDLQDDVTIYDYTNTNNIGPAFAQWRARGTSASPQPVQAGDIIASFPGIPYTGTAWTSPMPPGAMITYFAEANATPTSFPTAIVFATTPANSSGSAERMRITGSGYVGIGTNPIQALDVNGNIRSALGSFYSGQRSNFYLALQNDRNMVLYDNGGAVWTSGTSLSDIRMKENITPLEPVLDDLTKLHAIRFHFKKSVDEKQSPQIGVIAQEVHKYFPEFVYTDPNGHLLVYYDKLTVVLLKGLQELKADNDNQAAALTDLKREFETYKATHP